MCNWSVPAKRLLQTKTNQSWREMRNVCSLAGSTVIILSLSWPKTRTLLSVVNYVGAPKRFFNCKKLHIQFAKTSERAAQHSKACRESTSHGEWCLDFCCRVQCQWMSSSKTTQAGFLPSNTSRKWRRSEQAHRGVSPGGNATQFHRWLALTLFFTLLFLHDRKYVDSETLKLKYVNVTEFKSQDRLALFYFIWWNKQKKSFKSYIVKKSVDTGLICTCYAMGAG